MINARDGAFLDERRGSVGADAHVRQVRIAGLAGGVRQALRAVHDARVPARCEGDRGILTLSAGNLDRARRPRGLPALQECLELLQGRGLVSIRDSLQVARHLEGIDESPGCVVERHQVVVIPDGDSVAGDEDIAPVAGTIQLGLVAERRHRTCAHVNQLQGSAVLHGYQDRCVVSGADDQPAALAPDLTTLRLESSDRLPLLLPLGGLPRPPGAGLGTRARHEDVTDRRQGRVIDPGGLLNLTRRLVHRVVADDELVADGRHAQRQTRGITPRLRVTRIPDNLRLRARNIDGSNVDPLVAARGTSHVQGRAVHQGHHVLVLSPDG